MPTFTDTQFERLDRISREFYKFGLNDDGEVFVRTSVTGEITPTGLKTDWIITTISVSTSAIKIPTTNLGSRNAISIHNLDASKILYIGPDNTVTANAIVGTTSGWEIGPGNFLNFDITDAIDIYAIAPSGTILVKVLEIA